jgi:hypothetical protein
MCWLLAACRQTKITSNIRQTYEDGLKLAARSAVIEEGEQKYQSQHNDFWKVLLCNHVAS